MPDTHDRLRGRSGHFEETIRAIRTLARVGIRSAVMFTLSRHNASDLIPVIRLVAKEGVDRFDFARLVPIGSARGLTDQMLTPHEYRSLLVEVLEQYWRLHEAGCRTSFGRKDHLWKLLYQELGLLGPLANDDRIIGGCSIGSGILTILADGTVYACRRLPIKVGHVPEESVRQILVHSPELHAMRRVNSLAKCAECDLLTVCRGCPAVAYGATGDYTSPDPQCWK